MNPNPEKALEASWKHVSICLQGFFNTSGSCHTGNTEIARERFTWRTSFSSRTGETIGTVMVFDETTGYLRQHHFYFSSINQSDDVIISSDTHLLCQATGMDNRKMFELFTAT